MRVFPTCKGLKDKGAESIAQCILTKGNIIQIYTVYSPVVLKAIFLEKEKGENWVIKNNALN